MVSAKLTGTQAGWMEFEPAPAGMPVLITIQQGRTRQDYFAELIPADFGTGIRFGKCGTGEVYHVNLDRYNTCDCPGHARHGRCKHVDAAVALIEAGALKPSPCPEHAEERPAKQYTARELFALDVGEVVTVGIHRVERFASALMVDACVCITARQLADCLAMGEPCQAPQKRETTEWETW